MNDPLRLEIASRMLGRWLLGTLLVFATINLLQRLDLVDRGDTAIPYILSFGWAHVVGGLALVMHVRAWQLRRRPALDDPIFLVAVVGPLIGAMLVVSGAFLDLWVVYVVTFG